MRWPAVDMCMRELGSLQKLLGCVLRLYFLVKRSVLERDD